MKDDERVVEFTFYNAGFNMIFYYDSILSDIK